VGHRRRTCVLFIGVFVDMAFEVAGLYGIMGIGVKVCFWKMWDGVYCIV
jgi:hypothetical protein